MTEPDITEPKSWTFQCNQCHYHAEADTLDELRRIEQKHSQAHT